MTDEAEIAQVPSSEAGTEEVVSKDESSLPGFVYLKLFVKFEETEEVVMKDESLLRDLMDAFGCEFSHRADWRKNTKLSKWNAKKTWSDQCLALLITVMGLFAGAAYMVLFSFHESFPISAPFKSVNLSTWELLTFPGAEADDFLVISTVTTTFILSIGITTIAVCFVFRKFVWGTFLTILSLFTIAAFSLSFFAMLAKFVPHHITIAGGNLKFPASIIVIFYDIYVILLVCAFAYTVQWWRSSWRKQDADVERKSVV